MEPICSNAPILQSTNPKKAEETRSTFSENNQSCIQLLPEHLIDQIKAGEVIERPSSLIKELIENSLDAGADHIEIKIAGAGLDLIKISDNGKGMSYDDLPFAFTRHATSKLEKFEDLYQLATFGFRGEALASIASISRVTCWSQPNDPKFNGGKIEFHGAALKSHSPAHMNEAGTTIVARDLFYNTPARLAFARSKQSEKNAIEKVLQAFLLFNPHTTFNISWEDTSERTTKQVYPGTSDNYSRALQILGGKQEDYWYIKHSYDQHHIEAIVAKKSSASTQKKQYLSANRRMFYDRSIHQIFTKSMQSVWPPATSGNFVILLDVPKTKIDVNVHPHKTQLKFADFGTIQALVKYVAQEITKLNGKTEDKDFPKQSTSTLPNSQGENDEFGQHHELKFNHSAGLQANGWHNLIHPLWGNILIDEAWLVLEWWKNHFQFPTLEQVPLLIAMPYPAHNDHKKNWNKWAIIFKKLGIEATLSNNTHILVTAVPASLENLPSDSMLTPLLSLSMQDWLDFMAGKKRPDAINTSSRIMSKDRMLSLISKLYPSQLPQVAPIRTWSALVSWWRS